MCSKIRFWQDNLYDWFSDYLLKQDLSKKCKYVMIRSIEECDDYGMDCDKESWMRLLTYLKEVK